VFDLIVFGQESQVSRALVYILLVLTMRLYYVDAVLG